MGKDRQRPLPLFWNPAMRGSDLTGADYPIQPISESTLTMVSWANIWIELVMLRI